jgi:c(7)-type cytochrome triheme protein
VRWLVAIAIVSCAFAARADAPPGLRAKPVGFDHAGHPQKESIPCTQCHAMKSGALVGKPGHAACFGACHGPLPTARDTVPAERMRLCNPCHAETALAPINKKALAVPYPPYVLGVDFALQLGHKAHGQIPCAQCHDKRGGIPHRRCVTCHDGGAKGFAMTACASCHTPGNGQPDPPKLAPTQIRVTTAFSHAKHATRGAAKQCTACHAGVAETNDRKLPRPTAAGCAADGCHDDKPVFGITTSCTKCHKDVPSAKFDVHRPDKLYSHDKHMARGVAAQCATCHRLGKTGETLVGGHASCAGVKCHSSDFGERQPTICASCHNATEPWRVLVADHMPSDRTEFGATLDHRKHPAACASCHSFTTAATELRPPRGHRACSAAGCHAVTSGPEPKLSACESCHLSGLFEQREKTRLAATWSVRAKFRHAPHAQSKGVEVACVACHTDLTSPTVLSLATPAKATCARCHDGQVAFKLTGTTCTRCHPGKPKQ